MHSSPCLSLLLPPLQCCSPTWCLVLQWRQGQDSFLCYSGSLEVKDLFSILKSTKVLVEAEPRKYKILPRNYEKFWEVSFFFVNIFYNFGFVLARKSVHYCFRTDFWGIFVSNQRKNLPNCNISLFNYHIFLLFINSSLEASSWVPLKIWTLS